MNKTYLISYSWKGSTGNEHKTLETHAADSVASLVTKVRKELPDKCSLVCIYSIFELP